MKRLLAFFLCIVILVPYFCFGASAEDKHTFYKIKIDAGSGAIEEKVVIKENEIYILATSFSNYTRFSFDKESNCFLIKGQELKKAFKSVIIDTSKKQIVVTGSNVYKLSDCFEINDELYLPLCQMLPILNADIYEVKDNVIYILNNKLSLAEILYDFNISDYYFNISNEFYNMDWASSLAIVPNYILDTVVNTRFDRLDIIYHSGEYNDYKDAFSNFLSDDNLYLKAMVEDTSAVDSTVEFFKKANDTAKDMKSAYGWIEEAGKTDISLETGGALLGSLKEYYNSGDLETDDLKLLNDAWNKKWGNEMFSFGDCIELAFYVYTYVTQVEDNRQMLNAVYNVESKPSKKETARKAAKQIYDLYGDNIEPALFKEVVTTAISESLEDLSPFAVYTKTAKIAGQVLEVVMPFSSGDISKLPIYSDIVLSASSKYISYDTTTDESTENLRLSLLLCMIASKKCFEVMDDVLDEDTSYYKDQIQKIEQLIMGLYIAEENTEFDSFEHFEEYKKNNLKKIKASLNALVLTDFSEQTPSNNKAIDDSLKVFDIGRKSKISVWDGSIATSFSKGDGSKTNPYVINSASELAYVSKLCAEGHNFNGEFLKLNCNINLNGLEWEPIGKYSPRKSYAAHPTNTPEFKDFQGNFNGNGHFVSNYTINKTIVEDDKEENYGLFGSVRTATIENLIVKNFNIMIRGSTGAVGGLIGQSTDTCHIRNCHATNGNISTYITSKNITSGGLIGLVDIDHSENENNCATNILNCSADTDIFISSSAKTVPFFIDLETGKKIYPFSDTITFIAGGLIGDLSGTLSTVLNCFSSGSIHVSTSATKEEEDAFTYLSHIGGLIAYSSANNVENCYSSVEIISEKSLGLFSMGGLVGVASRGTISNCYSSGNLTIKEAKTRTYCGGLIGKSSCSIENCFVVGKYNWEYLNQNANFLVGVPSESSMYTVENCYVSSACRIKEKTPINSQDRYDTKLYSVTETNWFTDKDFILNKLRFEEKPPEIYDLEYSGWIITDGQLPKMYYEETIKEETIETKNNIASFIGKKANTVLAKFGNDYTISDMSLRFTNAQVSFVLGNYNGTFYGTEEIVAIHIGGERDIGYGLNSSMTFNELKNVARKDTSNPYHMEIDGTYVASVNKGNYTYSYIWYTKDYNTEKCEYVTITKNDI